jgi:hypothetical protein
MNILEIILRLVGLASLLVAVYKGGWVYRAAVIIILLYLVMT